MIAYRIIITASKQSTSSGTVYYLNEESAHFKHIYNELEFERFLRII